MSALPDADPQALLQNYRAEFACMTGDALDAVMAIEQAAYAHPWSRGNFADSLRAGYEGRLLRTSERLLGYFMAMKGVDEVHLLNITVAPDCQGQGLGACLLESLAAWSLAQGAQWLWLEVRASNEGAQRLYQRRGFRRVGLRKGYYPAGLGRREDAIVMSRPL
jgi:ribosomal-protein-alanine N-acetyltransferase